MRESKYHQIYDQIPPITLDTAGFPVGYNGLSLEQIQFFQAVVDSVLELYNEDYLELVTNFRDEMQAATERAQEIIDESIE